MPIPLSSDIARARARRSGIRNPSAVDVLLDRYGTGQEMGVTGIPVSLIYDQILKRLPAGVVNPILGLTGEDQKMDETTAPPTWGHTGAVIRGALGMDFPHELPAAPTLPSTPPAGGQAPQGHIFQPGEVDPATGETLEIQYGTPGPKIPPTRPPMNPPMGGGGPVGPSEPIVFDGGGAATDAAGATNYGDEAGTTETLPAGRTVNELLAPEPSKEKQPKPGEDIPGSGPPQPTQFDLTSAQENADQTAFLQGGRPGQAPGQDVTGRSRRQALEEEFGGSAGIMSDLFMGGGVFGGGGGRDNEYIQLF